MDGWVLGFRHPLPPTPLLLTRVRLACVCCICFTCSLAGSRRHFDLEHLRTTLATLVKMRPRPVRSLYVPN